MSSTTQKLKTERVNDLYSKEWKKNNNFKTYFERHLICKRIVFLPGQINYDIQFVIFLAVLCGT